jgi:hypothetical protein
MNPSQTLACITDQTLGFGQELALRVGPCPIVRRRWGMGQSKPGLVVWADHKLRNLLCAKPKSALPWAVE